MTRTGKAARPGPSAVPAAPPRTVRAGVSRRPGAGAGTGRLWADRGWSGRPRGPKIWQTSAGVGGGVVGWGRTGPCPGAPRPLIGLAVGGLRVRAPGRHGEPVLLIPSCCRALVAGAACLAVSVPVSAPMCLSPVSPVAEAAPLPADVAAEALADRAAHVRARPARGRAAAARGARVAAYARAQRGKPYRWGAAGPRAYDCSGLAWRSYRVAGRRVPRTAAAQSRLGRPVARRHVRPGDLVYWGGRGSAWHVGVVVRVSGPRGRARVWIVDAPGWGRRVAVRHPWPGGGHRYARLL